MNAIASSILVLLIFVVVLAPRRWALLGMIAGVLYLTEGASISLFGINMFAIRFLEIAGFVRVMVRREFSFSNLNKIDHILIIFYSYLTILYLLRSNERIAYQVGLAVDALLCYFTFRGLVAELDDFRWFLRALALLLVPFVGLVIVEMVTHQNQFGMVGQSVEATFRNDRLRCLGSFRHPISLGTLGASLLPLYIGVSFDTSKRALTYVGIGLCMGLVYLSNSGGPVSAVAFGLVGWLGWFMREKMFLVRRGVVVLLILFAVFMKAPIWYLPAKVSDLTGGGGWHRSYLLQVAFEKINLWWLAGMDIKGTKDWMPYVLASSDTVDVTNQYLSFGLTAGIGAIGLFILLLTRSFQAIGRVLNIVRSSYLKASEIEYMFWGLGVMLVAHVVNWFGVCYFDQLYVVWFMQLAQISSLSQIYTSHMEKIL